MLWTAGIDGHVAGEQVANDACSEYCARLAKVNVEGERGAGALRAEDRPVKLPDCGRNKRRESEQSVPCSVLYWALRGP